MVENRLKFRLRRFLINNFKKQYLKLSFIRHVGYKPDFNNPKSFNEKINWFKLYGYNEEYMIFTDKYRVRDYIIRKIGDDYLVPVYGIYDSVEELQSHLKNLPDVFVLKTNHSSGQVLICRDKNTTDWNNELKIIDEWLKSNFYDCTGEWQYKYIKPCIICEELLDDRVTDYKFYCFSGKADFLYISKDLASHNGKVTFLDMKGRKAPFQRKDYELLPESESGLPSNMNEMRQLAEKLSEEFEFVRVDLYSVRDKIYFSELTFTPSNGLMPFQPVEWDYRLGDKWKLETGDKHEAV